MQLLSRQTPVSPGMRAVTRVADVSDPATLPSPVQRALRAQVLARVTRHVFR
jgi:hypothetical protein